MNIQAETNREDLAEQLHKKEKEYLYLYAELENFKKRCFQEQQEIRLYGCKSLASDLLGVIDNLERALKFSGPGEDSRLLAGVKLTLKQLQDALSKHGIRKFDALGKEFDPNWHEAIASAESEKEKDTIIAEESPGYSIHEKLLRPARVTVSKGDIKDGTNNRNRPGNDEFMRGGLRSG